MNDSVQIQEKPLESPTQEGTRHVLAVSKIMGVDIINIYGDREVTKTRGFRLWTRAPDSLYNLHASIYSELSSRQISLKNNLIILGIPSKRSRASKWREKTYCPSKMLNILKKERPGQHVHIQYCSNYKIFNVLIAVRISPAWDKSQRSLKVAGWKRTPGRLFSRLGANIKYYNYGFSKRVR